VNPETATTEVSLKRALAVARTNTWLHAVAALACLLFATGAYGSVTVPAGGTISLASGALDLGCTDITVAGNLQVGSALITTVRDVTIQAGTPPDGTLDGGSGSITLAGNWSNSGAFFPGTSSVFFVDNPGCAASSTLSGNTTFYNLSLVSSLEKIYTFTAGTTQTILHALTIQGTLAHPIQIASSVPGDPGFINLASGGTQNISHVGVSDNWATGQPLAPSLTSEGGTGNSRGWFGVALNTPIPALGTGGMALLALILAGFGVFFAPRRRQIHEGE
jgi:exosortase sorting signal-containing protein